MQLSIPTRLADRRRGLATKVRASGSTRLDGLRYAEALTTRGSVTAATTATRITTVHSFAAVAAEIVRDATRTGPTLRVGLRLASEASIGEVVCRGRHLSVATVERPCVRRLGAAERAFTAETA